MEQPAKELWVEQVSFVMRRKKNNVAVTAEMKPWLCMAGQRRPYHGAVIQMSSVRFEHSLNTRT